MPIVMNMPKIGVNMTDAVIVEWIVKEGDEVKEGDHILDAETDKAVQEIYATVSGRLTKILAPAGAEVLCQQPIAEFAEPGEQPGAEAPPVCDAAPAAQSAKEPPAGEKPAPAPAAQAPAQAAAARGGERVRISPLARKTAGDLGIPVAGLQPAEPGARIVKADVLARRAGDLARSMETGRPGAAAAQGAQLRPAASTVPYAGIRRRIGERMTESWQTKPAVALTLHADAGRLIEWREGLKAAGRAVSYNDLFVRIAARALREHPEINARLAGNAIERLADVHIGVAVDTERGLVVPVIRNADRKSLADISSDFRAGVEAVRAGRAAPEDLSGGTFTITNLGMYEIEHFSPIINPPECCILALGAIVREPVADARDNIVVQSRLQMTLVFDHRIVDGAPAARFLQRVKHLVQCPMELID